MNGFYSRHQQYGGDDMQDVSQNMMGMMGGAPMPVANDLGAQSFDGVGSSNDKSMRRRSMPTSYGSSQAVDISTRRMTMMDFTDPSPAVPINGFNFDPVTAAGFDTAMTADLSNEMNGISRDRRASHADLSINTQHPSQAVYGSVVHPGSAFGSSMTINTSLDIDPSSPYITSGIQLPMDLNMMGNDLSAVDMFGTQAFESPMLGSPMQTNFAGSMMGPPQDPGGGMTDRSRDSIPHSIDTSMTPNFRLPGSATTNQEGNAQPSTAGTSASDGQQTVQMPRIQSQVIPPTLNTTSFTPHTALPNAAASELIGGTGLPWSIPTGQYSHFIFA